MELIHFFTFRGRNSRDFGIYISGENTFGAPELDVDSIEIPGRNGSLTISQKRYKNIVISYPSFIRRSFYQNCDHAKMWLLGSAGYHKLEDTYHPDYFREAQFKGPIDFEMRFLNYSGGTSISFDCKPQRWRKDGQTPSRFVSNSSIYNNWMPSLPLIKINGTGSGNVYIGGYAIKVLELDEYVMVDSDTQNAYKNTQNKNSTIYTEKFPVLENGENTISFDGGVSSIDITPRWWSL